MMDQNDLMEAAQLLEEFLDFYHFPDGVCRSRPVARMAARMPNPDIGRMKKVCIIGGGPAGIMVAGALQGHAEIYGFERANDLFGQWADNTDEMTEKYYGSRHSSMYAGLQTNAPKESNLEVPNFPFKEPMSSYPPAEKIRQYLRDYVEKFDLRKFFQTSTNVEKVSFDEKNKKFSVSFKNVVENKSFEDEFDYVVVCVGHFNYPNLVSFPGEDSFRGQILHSHDFKNGSDFKGKKVLCIGGSYSAEDICLSCWKNGAEYAHVSTRKPAGFGYVDWPKNVEEHTSISEFTENGVKFQDGTENDYDVIIKCTGYVHKFDFLPEEYSELGGNIFVPNGLYKQCISMKNEKLWFIGMQNLVYSTSMFQLQGYLLRDTITGKFTIPDRDGQKAAFDEDKAKEAKIASVFDVIQFQTDYVNELSELTKEAKIDAAKLFCGWVGDKTKSILKFREGNYTSVHTGF